jgi:uncharacterized LabA/DUF88 family protein
MTKVICFIDGFNLYHALNYQRFTKYKWLDLSKLTQCFLTKYEHVENIYYFTALATWSPTKINKHKIYIKALQSKSVQTVYGEFKRKTKFCTLCKKYFPTFEEKQTDVNIAIYLLRLAMQERYEKAIIISGDSDLIPAIKSVQKTFPTKKIGIVLPIGRASESLKNIADFHMKMKEKHLTTSLLNEEILLTNNQKIICPHEWKL